MSFRGAVGALTIAVCGALCFAAPAAQAALEQGHPELYENFFRTGERSKAGEVIDYGPLRLESAQLGGEGVECTTILFGSGWNEGAAPRARGQILGLTAASYVTQGAHPTASADCRPQAATDSGAFITDEPFVRSEENPSQEVEPRLRKLSVPWNLEATCGVRNEEYAAIVTLGVPSAEFPRAGNPKCPESLEAGQAEEEQAYTQEREEKKGCYSSNPAPEGCVRITLVDPGEALEIGLGGSLRATDVNGVRNGLFPTTWHFEGTTSGTLQVEFPAGVSAPFVVSGKLATMGYVDWQLEQLK